MKISDVMTREIKSLNPNDNINHAADLMRQYNVGSLPVCENNKVIGIITDRDITIRAVAEGDNSDTTIVRDIMSTNPVYIDECMDSKDAGRIMSERQIRRLPVVDKNKTLVGIVSLGDIATEPYTRTEASDALSSISEPSSPEM